MSYSAYYVFDTTTGEILRWGNCPTDQVTAQAYNAGEEAAVGAYPGTLYYVDDPSGAKTPTAKSAFSISQDYGEIDDDGVAVDIWSNVPVDTVILAPDGVEYTTTTDNDTVAWSCKYQGDYSFTFTNPKYYTATYIVTVNEVAPWD